jgi:hypothetical protein
MAETLSGFPSLVPAIVTKVNIADANPLGVIHNGSKLTHYVCSSPSPGNHDYSIAKDM